MSLVFFISFPTAWRSEVIPRGTQPSWLGTTSHNFLLNVEKNPSHASQKNATGQRRYYHAVVLNWAIKHCDFQNLAGLWLARLINNHVRIYGSNVAEGFWAFQRRSCYQCMQTTNSSLHNSSCHSTSGANTIPRQSKQQVYVSCSHRISSMAYLLFDYDINVRE